MMVLVTGGASSGKSSYAEFVASRLPGPHYYLAAMKPFGAEAKRRIQRHRELRAGKGFQTIECHAGFDGCMDKQSGTALLECLGNVVANELFSDDGTCRASDEVIETVLDSIGSLSGQFSNLVIVDNEVGSDGMRYDGGTEDYICVLGAVSCALAQRCDSVVECIVGQPMVVKGSLPS